MRRFKQYDNIEMRRNLNFIENEVEERLISLFAKTLFH
jgi:hypothetical protein